MVCPFITKNIYLIKSITVLSFVQIKRIAYRRRIFDVINAILKNTQGYIAINAEYESKFAALLWIKVKISQVGRKQQRNKQKNEEYGNALKNIVDLQLIRRFILDISKTVYWCVKCKRKPF